MVSFRLLGPLEVRDGESWRAIGAPKWRSVLAVLLVNANQVVSVDTLIDEVWDESVPAKAANLISIYVLRLRRLIGDADGSVLVTRSPGYLLRTGQAGTDVQVFEAMVREGRQALAKREPGQAALHLAKALALWRGNPLADVPRTTLIGAEAERLAELRLDTAQLRISAELACGSHGQVIPELRRLVADNPLREELWLLLVQALADTGRQAEALDAYGQARNVISGELGVEPGPELRRLHAKLLADDARIPPADGPAGSAAGTAGPPQQTGSHPAVDLRTVTSRAGFGRALNAARQSVGHTIEEVAQAAWIAPGIARDYFAGRAVPDPTEAGLTTLRAVLAACGIRAPEQVISWTDALARAWAETTPAKPSVTAPGSPQDQDSPGSRVCPDPLTAQTAQDLIMKLAELRLWYGEPSFRDMARAGTPAVAASTLWNALNGSELPSLRVVRAIISGCGASEDVQQAFITAWRQIRLLHGTGRQRKKPPGGRHLYPLPDTA